MVVWKERVWWRTETGVDGWCLVVLFHHIFTGCSSFRHSKLKYLHQWARKRRNDPWASHMRTSMKLRWDSTGWKRTFSVDETRRRLTTRLRIHRCWTHIDWTTDEESSEHWTPPSSGGGCEVPWPRETPGSPWGLRTTRLQRFIVLKICSLTFSSRSDTNRAAERRCSCRHHLKDRQKIRGNQARNHLSRKTGGEGRSWRTVVLSARGWRCSYRVMNAPSGQSPALAESLMNASWLKSESCEIRTASVWLNKLLRPSWPNWLKPVARHTLLFPSASW